MVVVVVVVDADDIWGRSFFVGNVGNNSVRRLKVKHHSRVELLGQRRQPMTGRLATHTSYITVER